MTGLNLNLGSSVLKRQHASVQDVVGKFTSSGWKQTGSIGNRVFYLESDGINLTVMKGPIATLVFPSGPIRGRLFGNSGLMVGKNSVLGDSSGGSKEWQNQVTSNMSNQYV